MSLLIDGLALGMLLFLISVGLAITLGLMQFVNLAHGAFAMLGGYVSVMLLNHHGVPFLWTLPLAFIVAAAAAWALETVVYRRLRAASALDQILCSMGVVFMAVAGAHYAFGARQQPIHLPDFLTGMLSLWGIEVGGYRLFLIGAGLLVLLLVQLAVIGTRWGRYVRAAVDNAPMLRCLGVNVDRLLTLTFALGSGLAGLGGALGVEMLGLDPEFPLRYLVYFLIVVAMGGSGNIWGSFLAALLLGLADVLGKYWVPQLGAFIIYGVMVLALAWRPEGLLHRGTTRGRA
ncbi:branched-chain amino acid ABC transporter permease [Castellaniella sp.]|uniref:branched-chain amino acid ABC transporter permease n=1 Tax=Castellaniella sp. TaxID=1955812 RepID=UPI00355DDC35